MVGKVVGRGEISRHRSKKEKWVRSLGLFCDSSEYEKMGSLTTRTFQPLVLACAFERKSLIF